MVRHWIDLGCVAQYNLYLIIQTKLKNSSGGVQSAGGLALLDVLGDDAIAVPFAESNQSSGNEHEAASTTYPPCHLVHQCGNGMMSGAYHATELDQ